MDGDNVAELMKNSWLNEALAKHARRYSKRVEDQEEYIQDAWLRIAEKPSGKTLKYYEEQGGKAIVASYMRQRYQNNVKKKKAQNLNGISATGEDAKPPPKRAFHVYANKYLDSKPKTLDWQYYDGQEKEIEQEARERARDSYGVHGWYDQYEGFEKLERREQEKLVSWFMNNGYQVGMPVGATPGKKQRFYEMYYTVAKNGVVQLVKHPYRNQEVKDCHTTGGKITEGVDLTLWYKVRNMMPTGPQREKINSIISEWEEYNTKYSER
jgi:hypothetical protein